MATLVLLLSEQHVPNLLSVHHVRPERLVLVETSEMRKRGAAQHFLAALEAGGLSYDGRCRILPIESEDAIEELRRVLQNDHAAHPDEQWVVNLTGGTKPMAIAAHDTCREVGGQAIYTPGSRPDEILFLYSERRERFGHRPSVREFLTGYGMGLSKSDQAMAEAEDEARRLAECARCIAQYAGAEDLLQLDDRSRDAGRRKGLQLESQQCAPALLQLPLREAVAATFSLSGGSEGLRGKLDRHAVRFLTGGWLEVFVWSLLERHQQALGLWDPHLGVSCRFGERGENDLDVVFMRAYTLNVVECKSGSQEHAGPTDVLYKIQAVRRQIPALRVRSYLVTTAPNVLDKSGAVKPSLLERAEFYNCKIVTPGEVRALAETPSSAGLVARVFGA